jgi:hypothetical protein
VKPSEVLDHQADLLERLKRPFVRAAWVGQLAEDNESNVVSGRMTREMARANAAGSIKSMHYAVREAYCYHVKAEMSALIEYVASQLENTDRWDPRLAPTRTGLMRIERPFDMHDVRGQIMRVSWVAWGPVMVNYVHSRHDVGEPVEATALWMWNDHRDAPDQVFNEQIAKMPHYESYDRQVGRWGFIGGETPSIGQRMGPAWIEANEGKRAQVLAEGDTPTPVTNILRVIHATWFLMGQTITSQTDADIDRATRKRAGRANLPPRVTVIDLRRTEGSRGDGESLVEWTHRWLVRGHIRWQPYGPREVDHEHVLGDQDVDEDGAFRPCLVHGCDHYVRRLWIAPYVKGPAGAPLITSKKVYALRR